MHAAYLYTYFSFFTILLILFISLLSFPTPFSFFFVCVCFSFRIGSAYQGLGNLDSAIDYYNKSLLEDYNDKTKQALKKLEADQKKATEIAYLDDAKSEEAKARGNTFYNEGKFPEVGTHSQSQISFDCRTLISGDMSHLTSSHVLIPILCFPPLLCVCCSFVLCVCVGYC